MHSLETTVETRVLARQGMKIKAIARHPGVSKNTVKRYLRFNNKRLLQPTADIPPAEKEEAYCQQRTESSMAT